MLQIRAALALAVLSLNNLFLEIHALKMVQHTCLCWIQGSCQPLKVSFCPDHGMAALYVGLQETVDLFGIISFPPVEPRRVLRQKEPLFSLSSIATV